MQRLYKMIRPNRYGDCYKTENRLINFPGDDQKNTCGLPVGTTRLH